MSRHPSLAPSSRAKQLAIVIALRDQIVRGRLAPGERVPARGRLARRFRVSGLTIQRALGTLKRDGFLFCRGRNGTFVSDQPPHLSRYGIVFEGNEQAALWQWSRYWTAILESAALLERSSHRRFVAYRDVQPFASCETLQQLLADMNHQRLAGVILPTSIGASDMLHDQGSPPVPVVPRDHSLDPRPEGAEIFLARALEYVARAGRRRVAAFLLPTVPADALLQKKFGLHRLGLTTRPTWIHGINPYTAGWIRHAVRAVLDNPSGDPANRPDALIIADDHLVEPAVEELMALRVDVPRDLLVLAYWNFPMAYRQALPIHRFGCDTTTLLRNMADRIDALRRGDAPERGASTPFVFEDELPPPVSHLSEFSTKISSPEPVFHKGAKR